MNWLTIIIFLVVIIFGAIGYCRGFLKTIFSLAAVILSVLLTAIVSPVIANTISKNEKIYNSIYDAVDESISESDEYRKMLEEYEKLTETGNALKETVKAEEFIDKLDIPDAFKSDIVNATKEKYGTMITVEDAKKCVCRYITDTILSAIVYVLTLIGVTVIMFIVLKVVISIRNLPLIREADKLAGMAGGVILGIFVVMIFMVVITMFANNNFGEASLKCINENEILSWLYEKNFILNWITKNMEL